MTTTTNELDNIALAYHLNDNVPDMHIENICQEYFIGWLLKFIKPEMSVLELGYGDGLVTNALSKTGCKLNLLEGSMILSEKAKSIHPNINCEFGLFENHVPNEPYDLVLAAHVLEHLDDPVSMLNVMKGWLKNDGILIVVVPNKNSLHRQLAVLMKMQPELGTLSPRDLVVGHKRVYSLNELESDINKADFKVVDRAGFFVKVLPNSMMLDYPKELLWAMNSLSDKLPINLTANLAVIAKHNI
jgi:2-polyprenyl-3-methyl-5-hydroxy-6-metoxy-1,4-benzoquinol methylase